MDTAMQLLLPLADCSVNDKLVKVVPFFKQSFFQMINIKDLAVVHLLLQNASEMQQAINRSN